MAWPRPSTLPVGHVARNMDCAEQTLAPESATSPKKSGSLLIIPPGEADSWPVTAWVRAPALGTGYERTFQGALLEHARHLVRSGMEAALVDERRTALVGLDVRRSPS